jgi:hypothetical protein
MSRVLLKKSSVAGKVPVTSLLDPANGLEYGELALNYADGKLYFKNSSNVITSFSSGNDLSAILDRRLYTVTTAGSNTLSVNYVVGFIDVFVNGVKLNNTEFTATSGATVVIPDLAVNDEVQLVGYLKFSLAGLTISGSGLAFDVNAGLLTINSATTATANTLALRDGSGNLTATNLSGTNTGDNAVNSLYSGLVTNATHTGDATGSTALTLATVNTNVGAFGSATNIPVVTVNAKGLVTAVSTVAVSIPSGAITITGDVTGSGTTGSSTTLTLATVNSNIGTWNNVTVNAKGLVTGGSNTAYLTAVTPSNFSSQTANTVLAAPNGSAGAPTFRAIVGADIPTLNQNTTGSAATITGIYSGTITSSQVTTGLGFTPYNATNPSGYTTNVGTVTSVAALTIATAGTDVTSTVATGTTTPVITLNIPTASATNRGALSAADWTTFNNKQAAITLTDTVASWATTGTFAGVLNPTDVFFKPDGTKMFLLTGTTLNQYTLSTAWDITTAGVVTSFINTWDTVTNGMFISPDGTKLVTCGQTAVVNAGLSIAGADDRAYYLTLGTAWDITTATLVSSLKFGAGIAGLPVAETAPHGITFNSDGTIMYMIGTTIDAIYQYTLTTAYDVSTATYSKQISIASVETGGSGIRFNIAGTNMYILGSTYDNIIEYRLSTAWDIATAVYYDDLYIVSSESTSQGLYLDETSGNAYIVGTTSDSVTRFKTNSAGILIAPALATGRIDLVGETRIKNASLLVNGNIYSDGAAIFFGNITANNIATSASSITLGGAVSTGNATLATAQTTGLITIGGTAGTGAITLGQSTAAQTLNLGTGATAATTTKVINIGTTGVSTSITNINLGSDVLGALNTIVLNGTIKLPAVGTSGFVKLGAGGQLSADTTTYATGTGTASGTNTGDNAVNSLYSGLVSNATHTGDVTGSTALTLATVNSNVGTWNNVTVNGKGLVTAGSNVAYLTSYTESDTLATVTGRGASTSTPITLTGNLSINSASLFVGRPVSDTSSIVTTNTALTVSSLGVDQTSAQTNAMRLVRDGTSGVIYAGAADFDIYRHTVSGVSPNVGLVIRLSTSTTSNYYDALTLESNGTIKTGTNNIFHDGYHPNADALTTARTIALTGDVSYTSGAFDGSGNVTGVATLATVNSNVGTWNNVTVNGKGLVTAGSNTAYLTSLTDTLATVTARGATTSTASTFSGGITHSGLTMTAGTNVDQIYTASDVLTLTTAWQDTSVNAAELVTGSYMVQVYADDSTVGGGQYMTYYTGIMSWYSGDTNEASSDEIVLHRAGHASTTGNIFLRVLRTMTADTNNMKLQIAGITANTGTSTYTYKFRRLI